VTLRVVHDGNGRSGIEVVAADHGPGIEDVERALQDGYTTGGGVGLGLPGARRLVDEFEIESAPRQGTTVRLVKWSRAADRGVRV
jgi:serine/threonine-protein kinase RsbT